MARHPTPQTPDNMIRDTLGVIARTAADVERTAMDQDIAGMMVHYQFLKLQIERLHTIQRTKHTGQR